MGTYFRGYIALDIRGGGLFVYAFLRIICTGISRYPVVLNSFLIRCQDSVLIQNFNTPLIYPFLSPKSGQIMSYPSTFHSRIFVNNLGSR